MERTKRLSLIGSAPLELAWKLYCEAPPSEAWAVFSNTHVMNRRVGVGVRYQQRHDDDGTPRRLGTMRAFGQDVPFEEDIFDYEAPHRVYIQRTFSTGPVDTYTIEIEISDSGDGHSEVDYRVSWQPRNAMARAFVRALFPAVYGRPLHRTLAEIESSLGESREPSTGALSPSVGSDSSSTIRQLSAQLEDSEVGERLGELLLGGEDEQVERLQVISLSRDWDLPSHRVLDCFLEAVSRGLLEIRWELLCPSCQGPGASSIKLDPAGLSAHCPSCNIAYDGSFADSLAVTFCPPPRIREVSTRKLCVGSPSWTPHILARAELKPRAEAVWNLDLKPGGYRLRALTALRGAHVEVRDGAGADEVVVNLEDRGVRPLRLLVRAGPVRITVRSRRPIATRVVLEDRWRPRDVLTAGHLLERPGARDLLPDDVLPRDLSCVVRPVGILVTELLAEGEEEERELRTLLQGLEPNDVFSTDAALYSTWRDVDAALDAAARLEGAWQVFNSLGHGAVLELGLGDQRQPAGLALEDAASALRSALPGRSVLSDRARLHPDLDVKLQGDEPLLRLEPGPRFDDRQDFLIEFLGDQPSPHLPPLELELPDIEGLQGVVLAERYELGACLGSGGFGVVYGAHDRLEDRKAVVKLLHPRLFAGNAAVQLFFREARALSLLDDPAIVRFHDFGHDELGRLFLVMEHLEGGDLDLLLEDHPQLPPIRAVTIAAGMLSGLAATHEAGLLHRDIKPSNVFLVEGGSGGEGIKLIDFGIVVDQVEVSEDDPEGNIVGTLPYMSIEQLRARPLGPASDLYAVGVVLWQMLTGQLPYPELKAMQSAVQRVRQGTPSIASVRDDLPRKLQALIDRSLQSEPQDRFPDAKTMREALLESLL